MQQLTAEQLKEYIDNDTSLVLLDVRDTWEYEICHINSSINIAMTDIPLTLQEIDSEKTIVVICHHGMRSFQVAQYLESEGFNDIMNLEGGIASWATTIDQSMPQY